jgi:hypothetical protein
VYAAGLAHRALALGLAGDPAVAWERVTEHFEQSIAILATAEAKLEQARTFDRWEKLLERTGRSDAARIVRARAVAEGGLAAGNSDSQRESSA